MNHHPSRFKRSMREVYPWAGVFTGPYRRPERQWKWIDRGMALALAVLVTLVVAGIL